MPLLTISIVAWNSEKGIRRCIESILAQSFSDYQILVIDNDSQDETCSIVRGFTDRRIKLYQLAENSGFCGGHNLAIRNSESEYLLLANPDIILSPNYIENALGTMQRDRSIGSVCGLLLQNHPSSPNCRIDSAGLEFTKSRVFSLRNHGERLRDVLLYPSKVFGADGALPLYRRSMIEDISIDGKLFDEMFFAHKEDWDVSWRSARLGWTTFFDPQCTAIHPRSFKPANLKSRQNMSKEIKYHGVKNQLILLIKNESILHFLRDFFWIVPRQLAIFLFAMVFEQYSLRAYSYVMCHFPQILRARKAIQEKTLKAHMHSQASL